MQSKRNRIRELAPSVSLEEISRQRGLNWPDFHPEDYCHRCGGRNASWSVDSDRFNAAALVPDFPSSGIVCVGCFVDAHEKATGLRATWKITPDMFYHIEVSATCCG